MSETLIGLGASAALGVIGTVVTFGLGVFRRLTIMETIVPRIEKRMDTMDEKLDTIVSEIGKRR